ncbi:MAG: VTT domain-containing protein [Verrucomicrobiota bacterium]|nr:VTT domain-containing protein [Verrucomicrobiota bacterium]
MEKNGAAPTENLRSSHSRLILMGGIMILIFLVAAALFYFGVDFKRLHAEIARFHGVIVFLFMASLPLVGFPVSLVYVVAGSKFGSGAGLLLCAVAIAVHLIGTYWIARFLRKPLENFLRKRNYQLPQVPGGEELPITLLTALIPGLPYAARNYLLALSGVPLKIYFWVCLPVYVFRSSLAIFFGDMTKNLTPGKITFLISYFLIKVTICAYILRRLRLRTKRQNAAKISSD